jgi:hypothetical protein
VGKPIACSIESFKLLVKGLFSFGNGDQAIDILGRSFESFFQMRLEIIE